MAVRAGALPENPDGLRWARMAASRVDCSRPQSLLLSCIAEFLAIMHTIPRHTAFLEVFAGAGMAAKITSRAGFVAHAFEVQDSDCQDGCSAVAVRLKRLTP